jgi:hypothetical protein
MGTAPATTIGLLGIMVVCSCKPNGDETETGKLGETGGDEGLTIPDVDLPDDESEAVPLPAGQCLQQPYLNTYGYVHQCEGVIRLGFDAGSYAGEDSFEFGPGKTNPLYWVDPDSYELPLVAACCGPFDYVNSTTEEKLPYVNNCLVDSVQQICHAIPYLLRRQAERSNDAVKKLALNSLANDVEGKAGECLNGLWGGGASDETPNRLIGTTWAPKQNVTFTLIEAEITDWTEAGEVEWNTCSSMFENDPAVIPTAPFEVPGTVGRTNATLLASAPAMGTGPGNSSAAFMPTPAHSTLTLAHDLDGAVHVSGLRLVADPSSRESDAELALTHASLTLRNVAATRAEDGQHSVEAGQAHFIAALAFEGDSRIVDMTNTTAMVLRENLEGDWELGPFELSYSDPVSGAWTLSLGQMSFRPGSR